MEKEKWFKEKERKEKDKQKKRIWGEERKSK